MEGVRKKSYFTFVFWHAEDLQDLQMPQMKSSFKNAETHWTSREF